MKDKIKSVEYYEEKLKQHTNPHIRSFYRERLKKAKQKKYA